MDYLPDRQGDPETITAQNAREFEPHRFSTEASDIGLVAGYFPSELSTTLGNHHPFVRATKKLSPDGDLMWVTYNQRFGCISLRVYND